MALIKCTECGKEISDKATSCPHCGAPIVTEVDSNEPTVSSQIYDTPKISKSEKKKGGCLMTMLKVIGILIVVIIILNIAFGGNSNKTATKSGEVTTEESAETPDENTSTDETTVEEPSAEEPDNVFTVGDIVDAEDCRITFLSAQEYDTGNEFLQPKDGYVYYQMEFEFENTGNSDLPLSSMLGWNCYADDYKVDQTWIGDENGLDGSVAPGKKAKGSVYFEIPKDASSIELEYETNFWTEDKIYFVVK